MNLSRFINRVPSHVASEALYYCLRAIKQAGMVSNEKKDFFDDAGESKPSEAGKTLTNEILEAISIQEGRPYDSLDHQVLRAYLVMISKAIVDLSLTAPGLNIVSGKSLLEKLRET